MIDRRRLLQALAACGVSLTLPACAQGTAMPRFTVYPFRPGVASGYPRPDGMVLWTRLLGDFPPAPIPVRWEISANEGFSAIVSSGNAEGAPEWGYSVHAEPRALEPDRCYWYRFVAGDAVSAVGRTRTAPAAGAAVSR